MRAPCEFAVSGREIREASSCIPQLRIYMSFDISDLLEILRPATGSALSFGIRP